MKTRISYTSSSVAGGVATGSGTLAAISGRDLNN